MYPYLACKCMCQQRLELRGRERVHRWLSTTDGHSFFAGNIQPMTIPTEDIYEVTSDIQAPCRDFNGAWQQSAQVSKKCTSDLRRKSRDRPAHATSFRIAAEGSAQQRVSPQPPFGLQSLPLDLHMPICWPIPALRRGTTPFDATSSSCLHHMSCSAGKQFLDSDPWNTHWNPRNRIQASEPHQNSQLSLTDHRSSNGRRQCSAAGHRQQAATGADMVLPRHGPPDHAPLPCRHSRP